MGRDGEGDKKAVKGWKGRGKDLPDQCQTASYAADVGRSVRCCAVAKYRPIACVSVAVRCLQPSPMFSSQFARFTPTSTAT